MPYDNDYILCDDSTKIMQYKCKKCNKSLWYCAGYGQKINLYKDSKSSYLHKRKYHKLRMKSNHPTNDDEHIMDEKEEVHYAIGDDFF